MIASHCEKHGIPVPKKARDAIHKNHITDSIDIDEAIDILYKLQRNSSNEIEKSESKALLDSLIIMRRMGITKVNTSYK